MRLNEFGGKMKRISCFSLILFLFVFVSAYAETDVSGDWEITIQTQRGDMTQSMTIEQNGESITVTMQGRQGREFTGQGTIKGNAVEWTITRTSQRGEFTMTYTGMVDGNSMSGEASVMNRTIEWSAVRK